MTSVETTIVPSGASMRDTGPPWRFRGGGSDSAQGWTVDRSTARPRSRRAVTAYPARDGGRTDAATGEPSRQLEIDITRDDQPRPPPSPERRTPEPTQRGSGRPDTSQ